MRHTFDGGFLERFAPGQNVLIHAVHQSAVQIEQKAHSTPLMALSTPGL
jgi:hypothetical protein